MQATTRAASRCYDLRSYRSLLHILGLLLNVSGVFRFWLNHRSFESPRLLLFNWSVCILLECVAVEILFQIPWRHLKLQKVTPLRYFVFVVILVMGLTNVYTMWQLCMEVYNGVLNHPEYSWMTVLPPLYLAMLTAMSHAIVLGKSFIVFIDCISLLSCSSISDMYSCASGHYTT